MITISSHPPSASCHAPGDDRLIAASRTGVEAAAVELDRSHPQTAGGDVGSLLRVSAETEDFAQDVVLRASPGSRVGRSARIGPSATAGRCR